jgi:hypothetical protein
VVLAVGDDAAHGVATEAVDPVRDVPIDDRLHSLGACQHALLVGDGLRLAPSTYVAQELGAGGGGERLHGECVHRHAFVDGTLTERVAQRVRHPEVDHRSRHGRDATTGV